MYILNFLCKRSKKEGELIMPLDEIPLKHQGRFINPHAKAIRRGLLDVLLWKLGMYDDAFTPLQMPEGFSYPVPARVSDLNDSSVVWINHSTFMIRVHGLTFLTDPIWSQRCSPFSLIGPKRKHPPAFDIDKIEKVDFVLISHNHYDHLDKKTVKELFSLFPEITWIVPLGVKAWFIKLGIHNVIELSWWQDDTVKASADKQTSVKVTSVPTQHFSGRGLFDTNKTLWCGYVVEIQREGKGPKCFYFAGDTGYNPHDFKAIGQRFNQIDLSLIPIGCYSPRVFMAPVHAEPQEAVRIHKEVGSNLSVAMHWKTFKLSDEGMNRPSFDLFLAAQEQQIDPKTFLALDPGYEINW